MPSTQKSILKHKYLSVRALKLDYKRALLNPIIFVFDRGSESELPIH